MKGEWVAGPGGFPCSCVDEHLKYVREPITRHIYVIYINYIVRRELKLC